MKKIFLFLLSLLTFNFVLLTWPPVAEAHAFGTLYTLPLPLWLYFWGAGAALVVSFLLVAFFTRQSDSFSLPKINLNANHWVIFFAQVLSMLLFSITILAGFIGTPSPSLNFAPNFFWIIFLLGLTYFSVIFGDIWEIINPWKIITSLFKFKPLLSYPKKLGYTPALIFYFSLIYLELLSGGFATKPFNLSIILLFYTILNFLAVLAFGAVDWFKYGEFFSVFFNLLSRLSLFSKNNLLTEKSDHLSLLLFILFMLSSTAFDGFRSTNLFFRYFFSLNPIVLLVFSLILFLFFYMAAIFLMKIFTKTTLSLKDLALQFSFSLIPIALAYNVAHYFTLLLIQGQYIIPLISDPFNLSWNLFNTADYQINVGLLGASFVWNFEVVIIIIGHILAVFLAHLIALRIFSRKQALISQIPMLILMVLYTVTGLWILSQPLTVGG